MLLIFLLFCFDSLPTLSPITFPITMVYFPHAYIIIYKYICLLSLRHKLLQVLWWVEAPPGSLWWSPRSWGAVCSLQLSLSSGIALTSEHLTPRSHCFLSGPTSASAWSRSQIDFLAHLSQVRDIILMAHFIQIDDLPGSAKILIRPISQLIFSPSAQSCFFPCWWVLILSLPNKYPKRSLTPSQFHFLRLNLSHGSHYVFISVSCFSPHYNHGLCPRQLT